MNIPHYRMSLILLYSSFLLLLHLSMAPYWPTLASFIIFLMDSHSKIPSPLQSISITPLFLHPFFLSSPTFASSIPYILSFTFLYPPTSHLNSSSISTWVLSSYHSSSSLLNAFLLMNCLSRFIMLTIMLKCSYVCSHFCYLITFLFICLPHSLVATLFLSSAITC